MSSNWTTGTSPANIIDLEKKRNVITKNDQTQDVIDASDDINFTIYAKGTSKNVELPSINIPVGHKAVVTVKRETIAIGSDFEGQNPLQPSIRFGARTSDIPNTVTQPSFNFNAVPTESKITEPTFAKAYGWFNTINVDGSIPQGYNEIDSGLAQHAAASSEGGANNMSDNTFKYLLDRLDQDIRDHKQEVRDRDQRLQAEMAEREKRYRDEAKEREERILSAIKQQSEDAKAREERFLQVVNEIKTDTKSELENIKQSVNRAEERIDATAKHVHSMVTTNFWGRVATVLAILAVGVSLWAALKPSTTPSTPTPPNTQSVSPNK